MGFDVYYNPTATALGGVARQAGQGEYSKFMQQMIAQKNAQAQQERLARAQLQQQRDMQEQQILAQQQRDADYQKFQTEQQYLKSDLDEERAGQDFKRGIAGTLVNRGLQEQFQNQDIVKRGWQDYVGSIKNWDDFSPEQMQAFEATHKTIAEALSSKAYNDQEKANVIRSGITKMQGIQQSVVPKQKTKQQEWEKAGRGVGDIWIDSDTGAKMTRTEKGPTVLVKGWDAELEMKYRESIIKSYTKKTEKGEITPDDAFIERKLEEAKAKFLGKPLPPPAPVVAPPPPIIPNEQAQVAIDRAMSVAKQYPMSSNELGLTPDNTMKIPEKVFEMLPVIEAEMEYVTKVNNPARSRELRKQIQKIKLLIQGN